MEEDSETNHLPPVETELELSQSLTPNTRVETLLQWAAAKDKEAKRKKQYRANQSEEVKEAGKDKRQHNKNNKTAEEKEADLEKSRKAKQRYRKTRSEKKKAAEVARRKELRLNRDESTIFSDVQRKRYISVFFFSFSIFLWL